MNFDICSNVAYDAGLFVVGVSAMRLFRTDLFTINAIFSVRNLNPSGYKHGNYAGIKANDKRMLSNIAKLKGAFFMN